MRVKEEEGGHEIESRRGGEIKGRGRCVWSGEGLTRR